MYSYLRHLGYVSVETGYKVTVGGQCTSCCCACCHNIKGGVLICVLVNLYYVGIRASYLRSNVAVFRLLFGAERVYALEKEKSLVRLWKMFASCVLSRVKCIEPSVILSCTI